MPEGLFLQSHAVAVTSIGEQRWPGHAEGQIHHQQKPVAPQPDQPSPIGMAAEWVARLTVVGMEMVVFGLGGVWLDERLRVKPLFALLGFTLGIGIGIFHLLMMTAPGRKRGQRAGNSFRDDEANGPDNSGSEGT